MFYFVYFCTLLHFYAKQITYKTPIKLGSCLQICTNFSNNLTTADTSRLPVPPVELSKVGSRAFPVAGPRVWNALPEEITSSSSQMIFCRRLNAWLFRKSFPDITVWLMLTLLTFLFHFANLEVALLLRYDADDQWRFYVGARGHRPPQILPRPPKFLDTVVLLLVELIGFIVNFA